MLIDLGKSGNHQNTIDIPMLHRIISHRNFSLDFVLFF